MDFLAIGPLHREHPTPCGRCHDGDGHHLIFILPLENDLGTGQLRQQLNEGHEVLAVQSSTTSPCTRIMSSMFAVTRTAPVASACAAMAASKSSIR